MILSTQQIIDHRLQLILQSDSTGIIQPLIDKNYADLIMNAENLTGIVQLMIDLINPLEIHFTLAAGPFDKEVYEIFAAMNDLGLIRAAQLRISLQ